MNQPDEPAKERKTVMTARTETESAAERARRLWDGNVTSTARALLKELLTEPEQEDAIMVLLPWITDRVRATIRIDVRHAEEAAWEKPSGLPPRSATAIRTQTGALPSLDNLELLLRLPVPVPREGGVQSVPWGEMTVADHQARIGLLRKPLGSIADTIGRHEWAIAEIVKYGVTCLGDIDALVLERDLNA